MRTPTEQPHLTQLQARAALVTIMRRMHAAGLNRGTSGNASIRVPGGMVVTPSGIPPEDLTPETMVFVAADGTPDAGGLRPSSEFRMHHHIQRGRPDAGAVVHCHSRYATILACCGRGIEPIHYMILVAGSQGVKVAPYATFGTAALADAVVATMGAGHACLMANHGQVTIGRNWQQALAIAEEVEEQAAITYGALMLGGGNRLNPDQLADSEDQFRGYGQSPAA
jgi:L-fuculose-phosphate aldolase